MEDHAIQPHGVHPKPAAASAPVGRAPLAQEDQATSPPPSPKPSVPRASLKPTQARLPITVQVRLVLLTLIFPFLFILVLLFFFQRGEESRRDWHDKRKSILLLQEQSRTRRLLAQWENAGLGLSYVPPPTRHN